MNNTHTALPYRNFVPGTTLCRPTQAKQVSVTLDDPGILVMTDFERTTPVTVLPMLPIPDANDRMIAYGVRLLFVAKNGNTILGIITATDILGERPIKHIQRHGGNFNEIVVSDIMTKRAQIEVIDYNDICHASVGEVIETMKVFNRQHALVVEDHDDETVIRGLLSTTRISQQLGVAIEPSNRARTFQELEEALVSAA